MNELAQALIGNGVGAPPAHVLEAIDDETAHRRLPGAPHSAYEEIWHLAFWQQLSLDLITWAASFCCVSFSERGRRLRAETPGEKSHVPPRRLQAKVNQGR